MSIPSSQEIFDKIVSHLRSQGERAVSAGGACYYRIGKLKCAAGCLISDEDYRESFEGKSIQGLILHSAISPSLFEILSTHSGLIRALQFVHDQEENPHIWEVEFDRIAKAYGLKVSAWNT